MNKLYFGDDARFLESVHHDRLYFNLTLCCSYIISYVQIGNDYSLRRVLVKVLMEGGMNRMIKLSIWALLLILSSIGLINCGGDDDDDKILISSLTFADPNLADCVISTSATYVRDLSTLNCIETGISDLSGIESLTSITVLTLNSNNISDISALSGLNNLAALALNSNNVTDISSLSGLTNVEKLQLRSNSITDISTLSELTSLTLLWLDNNNITDTSALSAMTGMREVDLSSNSITTGVTDLVSLTNATFINLFDNNSIPSADLTTLTTALPGVVTEPSNCM